MNCTATTRLTAEECLARLDALRPMPRGERLAGYTEYNQGAAWQNDRNPLWICIYYGDGVPGPIPKDIRRWASTTRRLREERRALRQRVRELERDVLRYGPVHQCWCGSTVIHHECNECGVTLDDKTTLGGAP